METSQKSNLLPWLKSLRERKPFTSINAFLATPYATAIFATLTLLSFAFALELLLYSLVILYALYLCLFGEDFFPLIPAFFFCYVSPAPSNNPARAEGSIFNGAMGIIVLGFAAIAVVSILLRIAFDENMGFKRLFTQKRRLTWGFLALGAAYLLSGIGNFNYTQVVWKNLFFAALQFLALFLLYFLFTGTTDWKKKDKNYLPWSVIFLSLLVTGELLIVFLTGNVFVEGAIDRGKIFAGWGTYNNMGAMISLGIPFAFYLATTSKRGHWFVPLALLLLIAVFFTCSRTSCLFAVLLFIACFILTAIKTKDKKSFWITVGGIGAVGLAVALTFHNQVAAMFFKLPAIFNGGNPDLYPDYQGNLAGTGNQLGGILGLFNDSNRFETYQGGLNAFVQNPVFGESFFQSGYVPYSFATLENFNGFFPPRWHNTFIQILASCGTVGMIAYLFHRIQTAILFFKQPSLYKTFVGLGVLLLLLMSLLDCHLFNIGPAFFYSICLAFAENATVMQEGKTAEALPLSASPCPTSQEN